MIKRSEDSITLFTLAEDKVIRFYPTLIHDEKRTFPPLCGVFLGAFCRAKN
jgi:hypothetical protein